VETEVSVKSLGWCFLCSVNIGNGPSLVGFVVSTPDNDFLTFNILSTRYIKNLLVLDVDEVVSGILEDLPPS
jgi:hypothetical protein